MNKLKMIGLLVVGLLVSTATFGYSHFGASVAVSADGNTAIVSGDKGVAYIYSQKDGVWGVNPIAVLKVNDYVNCYYCTVSISGNGTTAIVASKKYDTGDVYIFQKTDGSWGEGKKLNLDLKPERYGNFSVCGVSISEDGTTAIVGISEYSPASGSFGHCYIFSSIDNWTTKLTLPFGSQPRGVSISGNKDSGYTAVVTLTTADRCLYILNSADWQTPVTLHVSTLNSVSISGNTVIVAGIDEDYIDHQYVFYAYIYSKNGTTWDMTGKIRHEDKDPNCEFGMSAAISNDGKTAIVGAGAGETAYIYSYGDDGDWKEVYTLSCQAQAYSVSIATDGNTAIVGSSDDPGGRPNRVYILTRQDNTWNQQEIPEPSSKSGSATAVNTSAL